jgi:transcriptional regulator with XRE-family HTH domain
MVNHHLEGLKAARIAANISAETIAERIGVDVGTYYRYENGTRRIQLDRAWVIADLLGTTLDALRHAPGDPRAGIVVQPRAPGAPDLPPPPPPSLVAQLEGWTDPE